MSSRASQSGVTLVVSLIMLVVLTLLVVSAIRFGNINLKITQNAQVEAEATAAAQVAIEQMMAEVNGSSDITTIAAKVNQSISTGATAYKVSVTKPACVLSRNVESDELDHEDEDDRLCYGGGGIELPLDKNNKPIVPPKECKQQQWEVQADVNDSASGAKLTLLQGLAVRVGVHVACP